MKKLYAFIALAILLSSCGNKMTLLKRHYTKGYYVQKNHKKSIDELISKARKENNTPVSAQLLEKSDCTAQPSYLAQNVTGEMLSQRVSFHANLFKDIKAQNIRIKSKPHVIIKPQSFVFRTINHTSGSSGGDINLVILVILAIFIPPLAVYLKGDEINKWFWITLLLCLFSFSFFFFVFGGSLWLAAIIIALLYVFDSIH